MDDQRTADSSLKRRIYGWCIANCIKRSSDHERITVAKHNGIDPSTLPGLFEEIPFGNTTTVVNHQSAKEEPPTGKVSPLAALALATGLLGAGLLGAGFGVSQMGAEPATVLPVPAVQSPVAYPPVVDAILEWETMENGEPRIRRISTTGNEASRRESGEGYRDNGEVWPDATE